MTKSLSHVARDILSGNNKSADQAAVVTEDAQGSLKAGSGHKDAPIKLSTDKVPGQEVQDLGGNTPTSVMQVGGGNAARGVKGKAKAPGPKQTASDGPKKLAKEETEESDDSTVVVAEKKAPIVDKFLSGGGDAKTKPARPTKGNFTAGKGTFAGKSGKIMQKEEAQEVELTQADVDAFDGLSEEAFADLLELASNDGLTEEGLVKFESYLSMISEDEETDEDTEVVSEEEETDEDEEVVAEETEETDEVSDEELAVTIDVSEDIDAIFNGEELSEEFKAKVKTVYEASMLAHLKQYQSQLEEAFEGALSTEVSKLTEELTANVDEKLNFFIEEWLSENQVAVVSGLQQEIAESFMGGMVNVLRENYIELPEEKVDFAEAVLAERDDLEVKLNEQIAKNADLVKQLVEHAREEALHTVSEGLTDTQTEKLRELSEGVTYVGIDDYSKKLSTIKESYFTKKPKAPAPRQLDEEAGEVEEQLNPRMEIYSRALSKTSKK